MFSELIFVFTVGLIVSILFGAFCYICCCCHADEESNLL